MGRFITLDTKFTGEGIDALPVITIEPILTNGSLVLLDPGHPASPITAAKNGASIINLARRQAADLTGVSDPTTLDATIRIVADKEVEKKVIAEITAAGGLHLAANTSFTGSAGASVLLNTGIADWLNSHYNDHVFFVGLSHRVTRVSAGIGHRLYSGATKFDSQSLWAFDRSGDLPPQSSATRIGYARIGVGEDTPGIICHSIAVKGVHSTFGTFAPPFESVVAATVGNNRQWDVASTAPSNSHILYSYYLEDLTISGRTFDQARVIWESRHNTLLATTGRYGTDTWTDPTQLFV